MVSKVLKERINDGDLVVDNNDAMYFSREPIPSPWKGWQHLPRYMQTGIIAFRRESLLLFNKMDETELERCESIDMNRVLESGGKVRMVIVDYLTIGVDTPEELMQVEKMMVEDKDFRKYSL